MEIIAVLLLIMLALGFFKILGLLFHASVFMLALPFKIIGMMIAGLVFFLIVLPLGLLAGFVGVVAVPLALLLPILPFLLIALGTWLLLRKR